MTCYHKSFYNCIKKKAPYFNKPFWNGIKNIWMASLLWTPIYCANGQWSKSNSLFQKSMSQNSVYHCPAINHPEQIPYIARQPEIYTGKFWRHIQIITHASNLLQAFTSWKTTQISGWAEKHKWKVRYVLYQQTRWRQKQRPMPGS